MPTTPILSTNSCLAGIGIEICFEHHPREKWPWYADRARDLGVRFVRLGEFIWDQIETCESQFHFDDLDTFIELLAERGIDTWLTTPTASPPDWINLRSPGILPVNIDGQRVRGETRRHTCPTSPDYRAHCERIVTALGQRYAGHPSVVAWQIDNEIGHPFCYCSQCHAAFQQWLEREFRGDVEHFNRATGQFFWARRSRSFEEIPLPGRSANPCLTQIYHRFFDHQIRECWGLQRQWLRDAGVDRPITTNAMATWYGYDHEAFFRDLDLVTGDIYPTTYDPLYHSGRYPGLAMQTAYLRGMKQGQNYGIAETRCGPTETLRQYPLPGEIRYWSHIFFGTGANFVTFFRLDTCPSGRERNTCGLIPASTSLPPAFEEIAQLSQETRRLLPYLLETHVPPAPVGLLYSHDSHVAATVREEFAMLRGPFGNGYPAHLSRHYRALAGLNHAVDLVFSSMDDLSSYRLLIVTAHSVGNPALASRLHAYVAQGGTLLLWPWSSVMDQNGKMYEEPLPAFLTNLAGAESVITEEYPPDLLTLGSLTSAAAHRATGLVQTLRLHPGTELLASLHGYPGSGSLPGLIRCANQDNGKGACYTVAVELEEADLAKFYAEVLQLLNIAPSSALPPGLYSSRRIGPSGELLFLYNSTSQPITLCSPAPLTSLLHAKPRARLTLAPLDVDILRLPPGAPSPTFTVASPASAPAAPACHPAAAPPGSSSPS